MNTSLKRKNKSLLIGLTGGIGSGKSIVSKIFMSLGVPIFNSDESAKNIINNDSNVIRKITSEFNNIYEDGKLNTQKMAEVVFNDEKALEKLNNIIHPKVKETFDKWVNENKNTPILIKEAAILIESGAYQFMDKIILVIAPEQIRLNRVAARDGVLIDKVKDRIQAQLSDEKKLAYADFTIVNDNQQMVIPQVIEILERLKKG